MGPVSREYWKIFGHGIRIELSFGSLRVKQEWQQGILSDYNLPRNLWAVICRADVHEQILWYNHANHYAGGQK